MALELTDGEALVVWAYLSRTPTVENQSVRAKIARHLEYSNGDTKKGGESNDNLGNPNGSRKDSAVRW